MLGSFLFYLEVLKDTHVVRTARFWQRRSDTSYKFKKKRAICGFLVNWYPLKHVRLCLGNKTKQQRKDKHPPSCDSILELNITFDSPVQTDVVWFHLCNRIRLALL